MGTIDSMRVWLNADVVVVNLRGTSPPDTLRLVAAFFRRAIRPASDLERGGRRRK
jgi:hypothetical protein